MIWKLIGVIKSLWATTLPRLITIGQKVHKHRVEITLIEDQPSDFDLSIPDLNAERNPLSFMENHITIFYNIFFKQRIHKNWVDDALDEEQSFDFELWHRDLKTYRWSEHQTDGQLQNNMLTLIYSVWIVLL